ncbi:MAG: methyl-accepting chemotaxis protein [Gammaproteobacteria bacterium]|nr:methyl-accepting chemotaxis protein [Gammaproteobacteria bacterium]MDH5802335.1 methyl-accepting chemotaxis protein [Gammaproteobacteria bacterium]
METIEKSGSRLNLGTKVTLSFIAVCVISILTVSLVSYIVSANALQRTQFEKLTAIRDNTASALVDYVETIKNHIVSESKSLTIIEAAEEFSAAFRALDNSQSLSYSSETDQRLMNYYRNEFVPRLGQNSQQNILLDQYLPGTHRARYLQDLYLAGNPYPVGKKQLLVDAGDGSVYSSVHAKYHPIFVKYLAKFGYYDLFIIDSSTGDILYSVYKEIDFASSVGSNISRNSSLASVFSAVQSSFNSDLSKLSEFSPYHPSYDAPAAFVGTPIVRNGKNIGTLVFQIPTNKINDIMHYRDKGETIGLGHSGQSYIVANDFTLRSDPRPLHVNKSNYINRLTNYDPTIDANEIDRVGSAIGIQKVRTDATEAALRGNNKTEIIRGYLGNQVLSSYSPITIDEFKWAVLSEMDVDEAFADVYFLRYILIVGTLVVLAGTIAFATFFSRFSITRPLNDMVNAVNNLRRGEGDLTFRIPIQSNDEIGDTARAVNGFVEKIQMVLLDVNNYVELISGIANQVQSAAQFLNAGSTKQAVSVQETSASMEEMNASINQNAENAKQTESIAINASVEASESGEVVNDTVVAMRLIAEKISLIEDIAYKTNLLALNAAIEAARAGDHGKGFAVVADEVRKLAERSQQSAKEISSEASNSLKIADRAGLLLHQMVPNIQKTADLVMEISAASEEQATGVQQVSTAIEQLDDIAQSTAMASDQLAETANSLHNHASNLKTSIGYFKLGESTEELYIPDVVKIFGNHGTDAATSAIDLSDFEPFSDVKTGN